MRVLITGGAGFIGSHLADALLEQGHSVRALDVLVPQVHGSKRRPAYLQYGVELIRGDVRDRYLLRGALRGIDAVYHFAARVGVGQSMDQIADYVSVNTVGTAVLLEEIARQPVRRLVVASSMSVYGEGAAGPLPTTEFHACNPASVYALSKYDQERLCLLLGAAYDISTLALRFFNVYGPRQALTNPYTGVLAIFAARLLSGQPPLIYEDGLQSRDFVSVHDVVRACVLALDSPVTGVLNVGSGQRHSVLDVATALAHVLDSGIEPVITGEKRAGDVRHCFADITQARQVLGYNPTVTLEAGLQDLAGWLRSQNKKQGRIDVAS